MKKINLSINPTYYCNFRCSFCYLSESDLGDSKKIDLDILEQQLKKISDEREITHIDLYGGEIGLLPASYFYDLKKVIRKVYQKPINIITNLSVVRSFFSDDDIYLSVSWDYTAREKSGQVYNNILSLKKDISVLILASKELVSLSENELLKMIGLLNAADRVSTVEIKPYSQNQNHHQDVSFLEHEEWIKKWLFYKKQFEFKFINEEKIKNSLSQKYSSWSDEHLYINPNGDLAVLEFDHLHKEFFLKVDSIADYEAWTLKERMKVLTNNHCSSCNYLGHCLSEHLQQVDNLDHSCNGFKNLLNWYDTHARL